MEVNFKSKPKAGQEAVVNFSDIEGPADIKWYVSDILKKASQSNCPDPPCHGYDAFEIPDNLSGHEIRVEISDRYGAKTIVADIVEPSFKGTV